MVVGSDPQLPPAACTGKAVRARPAQAVSRAAGEPGAVAKRPSKSRATPGVASQGAEPALLDTWVVEPRPLDSPHGHPCPCAGPGAGEGPGAAPASGAPRGSSLTSTVGLKVG